MNGDGRMTDGRDENDSRDTAGGGVSIGGSMTGGAIATGADSTARDTSRTAGGVPVADLPAPTAPVGPATPGGVSIGGHLTGGALATGAGSEAVYDATHIDAAHRQLLEGIAELRQHLTLLARNADVDAADGELAGVQDEITRTGHAEPGRLRRLRDRLTDTNTALAALASAAAVAQAIQGLVG